MDDINHINHINQMDRTGHPTFIFVVDGEVAEIQVFPPVETNAGRIAALSSDPKVYVFPGGFTQNGSLPQIGSPYLPTNN